MIFEKYSLEEIASVLSSVVAHVTGTMTGIEAYPSDADDDYTVGQTFYLDACQPIHGTYFLELSLEAKKIITEKILEKKWETLKSDEIDDCLLEFTKIIALRTLAQLTGGEKLLKAALPMVVYDEYEDNVEVVSMEDLYRVDFRIDSAPFSVIVCGNCIVR